MKSVLERLENPGFSLEEIRDDFSYLKLPGDPIIYLDNAATTQRPEPVLARVDEFYRSQNGNPLRGAHRLGSLATEVMLKSRQTVADFINANPEEIVFTKNASESLNLISYAYGLSYLKPGDHILITRMEHHSNCVNWQFVAEKTGAELIYIDIKDNDYTLDMADYEAKLSNKTKIVAFSAASNVLGTMPDSKKIIELAHAVGAITVVDAAQLALHAKIDVKALNCDFLAFSGHKMLAPFGIGVLYGKKELLAKMPPFLYGGEMIEYVEDYSSTFAELPYKFESGTQDVGGMVGLASAIEYINKIGLPTIADYENALTSYTKEKLEELDYIEIYHAKQEMTAPVIAFNVKDAHPHDVATILDHYGVAVRAGHHCTQPLHRRLGQNATNRVSFAFYNTKEEVDTFIDALAEVRTIMHLD